MQSVLGEYLKVVTSFKVVADQIIVKKIVIFLNFFTLRGWTNFIGIKVRIDKKIITIKLTYRFVFKIKKYKTTIFHKAGKPLK